MAQGGVTSTEDLGSAVLVECFVGDTPWFVPLGFKPTFVEMYGMDTTKEGKVASGFRYIPGKMATKIVSTSHYDHTVAAFEAGTAGATDTTFQYQDNPEEPSAPGNNPGKGLYVRANGFTAFFDKLFFVCYK